MTSHATDRRQSDCVALVTNRAHLERCFLTIVQLRWFGKYKGDIVIVVGDDLMAAVPTIARSPLKVKPKYFADLDRSDVISQLRNSPNTSSIVFSKPFQFHKIHIFDSFFKQWKKVLYVDTKMRVFNSIHHLLNLDCKGSLIAHSDAYPDYTRTLRSQFNYRDFPQLAEEANQLVSLDSDYFQTGMMIFDTEIISGTTIQELVELAQRFINSNSNEQAIINLWAQSHNLWKKLPTHPTMGLLPYDYWERAPYAPADYVLLKYPQQMKEGVVRKSVHKLFKLYWSSFSSRLDKVLIGEPE